MSANLERRIAAMEEILNPGASDDVPVLWVQMGDCRGDTSQPLTVVHEGQRWSMEPGETKEVFQNRATAGALAVFKPEGKFPTLLLVARHPSFTREKWLERYGPDGVREFGDVDE